MTVYSSVEIQTHQDRQLRVKCTYFQAILTSPHPHIKWMKRKRKKEMMLNVKLHAIHISHPLYQLWPKNYMTKLHNLMNYKTFRFCHPLLNCASSLIPFIFILTALALPHTPLSTETVCTYSSTHISFLSSVKFLYYYYYYYFCRKQSDQVMNQCDS